VWGDLQDYAALTVENTTCCSCNSTIQIGDLCAKIKRYKVPDGDEEWDKYGEDGEIPMSPAYMCETCADIANSLSERGFCPEPWNNQHDLLAEYVEMNRSKP